MFDKKEYSRRYYKKNKDKIKEQQKKWYEKHPNYKKELYQKNKDKIYQQQTEYRKKHKQRFTELCIASRRRRAERLRAEGITNPYAVINGYQPKYKR